MTNTQRGVRVQARDQVWDQIKASIAPGFLQVATQIRFLMDARSRADNYVLDLVRGPVIAQVLQELTESEQIGGNRG